MFCEQSVLFYVLVWAVIESEIGVGHACVHRVELLLIAACRRTQSSGRVQLLVAKTRVKPILVLYDQLEPIEI